MNKISIYIITFFLCFSIFSCLKQESLFTKITELSKKENPNPFPGNSGAITISGLTATSIPMTWTAAVDTVTTQADLQYRVFYSILQSIDTVTNVENYGTPANAWTSNITSTTITGLSGGTNYNINVLVMDGDGNKSAYQMRTVITPDATAPTVGGTIAVSGTTANSISISWPMSTDNVTAQADLLYKVFRSTTNDIDTVARAESNGIVVVDWTANLTGATASSLSDGAIYYFNVLVQDENGNKTAYAMIQANTVDTTSPTTGGNGIITVGTIGASSIAINWTAATDNFSASSNLQYLVVRSISNDINTVVNAETNGITVQNWTSSLTSVLATGLSEGTTYFFNVIVRDEGGNKSAYASMNASTLDITSPVPGGSGVISISSITTNSLTLSWTSATDNVTSSVDLEYRVVQSMSNNIDTVLNAETNGTTVQNWTMGISSIDISGLNDGTVYYFNVLVRDSDSNISVYNMTSVMTIDATPPVPSGSIMQADVTYNSVDLSWIQATDNTTPQASLLYIAVYSLSNNISTASDAIANGTPFTSWTSAMTSVANASLPSPDTSYYINVVVKDDMGNSDDYGVITVTTPENIPPTPGGSGIITVSGITADSVSLSWSAGSDNITLPSNLQYKVVASQVQSDVNNIASAEAISVPPYLVLDWSINALSATASSLSEGVTYYFNILIKDDAGNISLYVNREATPDGSPPIPGNGGQLSVTLNTYNNHTVNWTAATDNVSSSSYINYCVYTSTADNISDFASAQANGLLVLDWIDNVTSANITGISEGGPYYVNVFVRDDAGLVSSYITFRQSTVIIMYNAGLYDGDLRSAGGMSTARGGVDAICQANDPGTTACSSWRGYISVDSFDNISQMQMNYNIPQLRVKGPNAAWLIGNYWSDLLDGAIFTDLNNSGVLSGTLQWWSGSDLSGYDMNTCNGWTDSGSFMGQGGTSVSTTGTWLDVSTYVCSKTKYLLCVCW